MIDYLWRLSAKRMKDTLPRNQTRIFEQLIGGTATA